MSFLGGSILGFRIMDLEIYRDEAVGDILLGHDHKSDKEVEKAFKEYERYRRLVEMGYEMLFDGKLEEWDWHWLADGGHLCDRDWYDDWFKKDLEKAGVSKEEYDKKWK